MKSQEQWKKGKSLSQRRGMVLMLAQLLVLLAYPLVGKTAVGGGVIYGCLAVVLTAAVYATSETPRSFRIALALSIPSFGMIVLTVLDIWLRFLPDETLLPILTSASTAVFFGYALARLFLGILRVDRITSDVLCEAVAVYLLMGFAWGSFYSFIERISPGSFQFAAAPDAPLSRMWTLLYYSFVTLTTLGYGDIVPATDLARSVAVIEAVMGVMYVAIIIARLAGLYKREETGRGH
jgi:hypothetical protein